MRKLSNINRIEFVTDYILIDNVVLNLNDNIIKWIKTNCNIEYTLESYIERSPDRKEIKFTGINGILIYTKLGSIDRITISSYLPNDSRNRFEGEIVVFGKKLPKPFLSDDIEIYFPGIDIVKQAGGYWERFKAWETVNYTFNKYFEIEILINRDPKYIGTLNLRKK